MVDDSPERFEQVLSAIEDSLERSLTLIADQLSTVPGDQFWSNLFDERKKVLEAVKSRQDVHHANWSRGDGITIPGTIGNNHTGFHNLFNTLIAHYEDQDFPQTDPNSFPRVDPAHYEYVRFYDDL